MILMFLLNFSLLTAGFSLFGHLAAQGLDLDLELEDDDDQEQPGAPTSAIPHTRIIDYTPAPTTTTVQGNSHTITATFDPSIPMFFPIPLSAREDGRGRRPKDLFDIAKEGEWQGFFRTETEYVHPPSMVRVLFD